MNAKSLPLITDSKKAKAIIEAWEQDSKFQEIMIECQIEKPKNLFNKLTNLKEKFTDLSGKYLVKYIQKAKQLNFKVSLIYLFLENLDTNISRVKNRVLNGGHNVPQDDIIRRFYRSKNMFYRVYKDIVDDWSIYYNSNEVFEKIAYNNKILDHKKYDKFLGDIQCN